MLRPLSLDEACDLAALFESKLMVVANVQLHDVLLGHFNLIRCNKSHILRRESRRQVDQSFTVLLYVASRVVGALLEALVHNFVLFN